MSKNMNLKTVMREMLARHSFYATERMYKRQFSKWQWFKYQTKKLQTALLTPGNQAVMCEGKTSRRAASREQEQ
ncbi:hypothetical protein ColLi_03282 [Colletotrichum liriopes]|uniref:Clr5 domain-containing protein n=1 Tax=Colletotrichum liriopes TaxID=708192 RepID=A0AA37GGD6_9PEZI|nr:hypothetical protein ColLi_03282 [Colletotrichum liriopes]